MGVACGRRFPREAEAIARNWREHVETVDPWRETGKAGEVGGEAQGYYVTSGPVNAYAKPSRVDTTNKPPLARAAHEKIVADLAFDAGLPLPPAILHRWSAPPAGDQPFVVLSLIPFLSVHRWAHVKSIPGLEQQMKLELKETASALVPLDTWVDNRDRANDGNLLVSKAHADPKLPASAAYIDYSYSLAHGWRNDGYEKVAPVGMFPTDQKDADVGAMVEAVNRIESLSDDVIRAVVGRIPDDFLLPEDKRLIIDGLLHRKSRVRPALKSIYGGIP